MKYRKGRKPKRDDSEGSVVKELANAAGIMILTVLLVSYLLHRIDLFGHWHALPF